MIRDKAQEFIVDLYIEKNLLKCCGVLSTGFGKSKVSIDIIKKLNPIKVLILVNSTILRDYNWEEEFIKWESHALFKEKVELVTYQAAYKWKQQEYDLTDYLVIADECDFAADTDELSKFFYEYPDVRVLGFTGFITQNKREWFAEYLPVFTELNADLAQKMKILNNIHVVFVQYDLSNEKTRIVQYKDKNGQTKFFKQSENNAYDYANKKAQAMIAEAGKIQIDFMMGKITKQECLDLERSYEYKIRKLVADRNNVLLHSTSTQLTARKLLEYIAATKPESKTIVFSKRTEQSIAICGEDYVYNGKIPKKKAQENFDSFVTGTKRILGVCDKVNRGVNIEDLDTAILETFFGSDTQATQRFGRLMRLDPTMWATVYILLPYYMRKEKNNTYTLQETQQVKWARNMLRSTTVKSSTVWNYCTVKPINK